MDMIERKKYLERLITRKENGLVKVITGIRRCGKSYLLFNIYKSYLKSIGVEDEQIICLALDDDENIQYRNPLELGKYIRSMTTDESKTYYVFLDEIQKVEPFSFLVMSRSRYFFRSIISIPHSGILRNYAVFLTSLYCTPESKSIFTFGNFAYFSNLQCCHQIQPAVQ